MYDFPSSPTDGQEYTPPVGGQTYIWHSPRWLVKGVPPAGGGGGGGIDEAPVDGQQYGRQDAEWTVVEAGVSDWADITGKPATFPPTVPIAWTDVSGKPSTFPPALPIAQSGVTNLVTDQAAQDTAIAGKLNSSAYTAADVLAKTKTVDGIGSGLDADLLDGQDGAWYVAWANFTGVPTTFPPTLPIAQADVTNLVTDLAAKIGEAPNDGKQYARKSNAWSQVAPAGPAPNPDWNRLFKFSTATVVPTTNDGTIRLDNANPDAATKMWISGFDSSGADVQYLMNFWVSAGNTLALVDTTDAAKWLYCVPSSMTVVFGAAGLRYIEALLANGVYRSQPSTTFPDTQSLMLTVQGGMDDTPFDNFTYGRRQRKWSGVLEYPLTFLGYKFSSTTNASGIAAGEIRFDNSTFASTTRIWMHTTSQDASFSVNNFSFCLKAGATLVMQDRRYAGSGVLVFRIKTDAVLTGSYWDIPVIYLGGTALSAGTFNQLYLVVDPPPAPALATVSDTAPTNPIPNQLWFESSTGSLFIYYNDGDTSQWVQVNATSA